MSKLMKNRPRLGRGLSSLLSSSNFPVEAELPEPTEDNGQGAVAAEAVTPAGAAPVAPAPPPAPAEPTDGSAIQIPLDSVVPNPHQPRRNMDEATLSELAASLKATGLIQPVVVRKVAGGYQLIAGERRWRAARLAGLASIPAILREVDSFTQAQMALVENIQRENLNPIDRAQAYRTLISQLGLTQAELAGRMGEDRSTIANHLRLLDLAGAVQTMISEGRLSLGHAKILAGISDVAEQERLANLVLTQGLSVRNLEKILQEGAKPTTPPTPAAAGPSAHLQDLEKSLSRQLGMKCQLRAAAKKGKGKLTIQYASLDQFDELMSRLGVSAE
ncbi:MAG TPA: ParB/RepB/Spo0J family partition protein [Tepidisphaeraceae bacterium]|nr:ParB/RepB/Spo0J family partition protein [Tepidisphaeraceae bacterium]